MAETGTAPTRSNGQRSRDQRDRRDDRGGAPDERDLRVLAELGRQVLARVDGVAEQMVREIMRSDPAYRDAVPEHDLRASCRRNAAQLLWKLTRPATASPDYRTFLHELGQRRVGQGLPLDSLLHAYRIGARTVWAALVDEARRDEDRLDALAPAATVLWELHDSSSSRISAAYRAAEAVEVRRTHEQRFAMVDALLAGRGTDSASLWQATTTLNLRQGGRLTVVVCEVDDPAGLLVDVEAALSGHGVTSVWRPLVGRLVGIVQTGSASVGHVGRLLEPIVAGRVGIGPAVGGVGELPRARRLAEVALATLPAGAFGTAVLQERLPEALLAAAPEIASLLVEHGLRGVLDLAEPERSDLVEVLEGYVASGGSVTATADALHYHRNTVMKRLRRVREVTGRDPNHPDDALTLTLAIKALRLVGP